ncbi:hypothetical protein LUZ63_016985 [Rhynchospora breviuscula]|uniref:BTB domain-containing protein n=1 Tax=Rhynchospora breviuscula TaxID=2022672 RepID=A0A9Q0C1L8_9POAL|nr:hypothetical protein LUZ63_016985 [Rhynchospora breviuscula]
MNPVRDKGMTEITEEPPQGSMLLENIRKPAGETIETTNVKFIVEGEMFSADSGILCARSSVFKSELSNYMATEEVIPVEDMQAAVFKILLEFVRTDNLPEDASFEIIEGLMVAAGRYALEGLLATCQEKLLKNLTIDTAVDCLIFADRHGFTEMKKKCFEFMYKGDTRSLAFSLKYIRMVVKHPSLLKELRQMVYESKSIV